MKHDVLDARTAEEQGRGEDLKRKVTSLIQNMVEDNLE